MNTTKVDKIFELLELVFRATKEGRVDKEEALVMIQVLFSEKVDEFTLNCFRYICLHRDIDEFRKIWGKEPLQVSQRSHYYA
jgi:hypothetical protein